MHLLVGNLEILLQINEKTGTARFCHCDQLGTTKLVQLSTGETVRCTYTTSASCTVRKLRKQA
jgi:hypothetical protein